jgi:hypothetical protein
MNDASRLKEQLIAMRGDNVMSHPLKEQLIAMRRQRERTEGAVMLVVALAALATCLALVATSALHAPAGWMPI